MYKKRTCVKNTKKRPETLSLKKHFMPNERGKEPNVRIAKGEAKKNNNIQRAHQKASELRCIKR